MQGKNSPRILDVPDDCWRKSLDFLESPIDIIHFRSISRRYSRLYDEFMLLHRTAVLAHLDSSQTIISPQEMESIKRDIVLIPGRWCGIENLWYHDQETYSRYLRRFHIMSKHNVICGSLRRSKEDFISLFLRSDRSEPLENQLLVAMFNNESKLLRVAIHTMYGTRPWEVHFNDIKSDIDRNALLMLLKQRYILHPRLGDGVWTMESECKQKQRRTLNDVLACIRQTCACIIRGCADCSCGGDQFVIICIVLGFWLWCVYLMAHGYRTSGFKGMQRGRTNSCFFYMNFNHIRLKHSP